MGSFLNFSMFNTVSFLSRNDCVTKNFFFFAFFCSKVFVQRDSGTFIIQPPFFRFGTTAASDKFQSIRGDADQASASGESLRRGDAEVQVSKPPPHLHVTVFLMVISSSLLIKLIFLFLKHKNVKFHLYIFGKMS